ncbi:hypothetical protein SSX86_028730 [Deinandra increscens subsp. villosa]|uniref:WAT1-related protein n=1 Tax=Deinandra increscens subsp. villosa TaxID=3103831 RepID=A0AAP0CEI4_9ASTR
MKEYVGMVATQVAQVLLMIVSKSAIADGMSSYSFIFYSNAIASLILLPLSLASRRSPDRPPLSFTIIGGFFIVGLLGYLVTPVSPTPPQLLEPHCSISSQVSHSYSPPCSGWNLLGSIIVVIGFYSVMWGKAKEQKIAAANSSLSSKLDDETAALLLQDVEEQTTSPTQ